jgi:hypothetical protein
MSQRRGGAKGSTKPAVEVSNEEMIPFSESLDSATSSSLHMDRESMQPLQQPSIPTAPTSGSTATTVPAGNATSLDARFDAEHQQLKLKAWKEGHFATGLVPATWEEEYASYRTDMRAQCMKMVDNDNPTPCGCCSALVCSMLGAGRVGNMAVLRQSTEWVEEVVEDDNGEATTKRVTRPRLDFVAGPYWPMLMFVTYPLILGKLSGRKWLSVTNSSNCCRLTRTLHIHNRCFWIDVDYCHSQETSLVGSGVGDLDDWLDFRTGIDGISRSWHSPSLPQSATE